MIANGDRHWIVQAADGGWRPLTVSAPTTAELISMAETFETMVDERDAAVRDPVFVSPFVGTGKIVGIAFNYEGHIREVGTLIPSAPVVFGKFTSSMCDPFADIRIIEGLTDEADYEVELAVVVGRQAREVHESRALEFVFGYCVANDVSARDCQRVDGQLDRSKSFDTFCPLGPWITTADEVRDPQALSIMSIVNGQVRQRATTGEMIFSVAALLSYVSKGITLYPGDVILTGTPPGVGFAMNPPHFLQHGDVVECAIEGLGSIINGVRTV